MVLLAAAETEVETREPSLCPTEVGAVLPEDDVAMLQVEAEEVPQDDQRTCSKHLL